MLSYKFKKTEGTEVVILVKPKNPDVKTLMSGQTYTLGGLFDLATEGVVSEENIPTNTALDAISQDEAIEMIQDMVAHKSPFIDVEIQETAQETAQEAAKKKEEK